MRLRNQDNVEIYPALMTIQEAARYAACGTQTARRMAAETGALVRIGSRVIRIDREKFLKGIRANYAV